MDNYTLPDTSGYIQKVAEPMRNHSERPPLFSEVDRNNAEPVSRKIEVRSEVEPEESVVEQKTQAFDSEEVQNRSEAVSKERDVHSDGNRNHPKTIRSHSETYRTAPVCSESHEGFSITVREAARIFEQAGVPRTERAITNWCNKNARGITRLTCCYSVRERKYYLSPQSIEDVITQERKKTQFVEYKEGILMSTDAEDLSEQVRNVRSAESERELEAVRHQDLSDGIPRGHGTEPKNGARETWRGEQQHKYDGEAETLPKDESDPFRELQIANFDLRVQLEAQKYLVRQYNELVSGEREQQEREKLELVDRLTDARYRIGSLEEKLLRLDAPKASVRDVETEENSGSNNAAQE